MPENSFLLQMKHVLILKGGKEKNKHDLKMKKNAVMTYDWPLALLSLDPVTLLHLGRPVLACKYERNERPSYG